MARKPLTAAAIDRLTADAQGLDIVGLKPGQHFDPVGDLDRKVESMTKINADRAAVDPLGEMTKPGQRFFCTIELPPSVTTDELIEAVAQAGAARGYNEAATRAYLTGLVSTVDPKLPGARLLRAREAASRLGYRLEVKP